MQGLDYGLEDNATLLCRIVELEQERDELKRNAEQVSGLQTGILGVSDFVSRLQGRRASGLEQELLTCEQKLKSCQKDNIKLQEELSEVYTIKSKFADLLKAETEKSSGLEKEVKYYQNQVAAAFADRDCALLETRRLQRKKDGLIEKITELHDRLDHVTSEYTEEKSLCEALYSKLENLKEESSLYKKVAQRFWRVREKFDKTFDVENVKGWADILLQDPEDFWNLKVEQESCARRKQVENQLSCCRQQLFCLTELVQKELQQLRLYRRSLKEDVCLFFSEEKNLISSFQEALRFVVNVECTQSKKCSFNVDKTHSIFAQSDQEEISEADTKFCCSRATSEDEETVSVNGTTEVGLDESGVSGMPEYKGGSAEHFGAGELVRRALEDPHLVHESESRGFAASDASLPSTDDSKALAQALQEKVSALLLLSQQEERHILESNTVFAMESQISFLKQQLLQVTGEKMDALVKLASWQEKCLRLQEQEKTMKKSVHQNRTFSSSHLSSLPEPLVSLSGDDKKLVSFTPRKASIGYLRHLWPKQGLSIHTKSLSHMLSLKRGKEGDLLSIGRLQAENTHLRESLISICHLCKSSNRLRQTIDRIAMQSNAQTETFFKSAEEEVDGVISEALLLKGALKKTPHQNDLGWDSIGSPLTGGSGEMALQESSDGETNDDLDLVASFGLQIVRLVLLAAQLQKRLLRHTL